MNQAQQDAAAARRAAPGTINGLHDAIKARMAPIAAGFWTMQTPPGEERAPVLVDGWLPPITKDAPARFPFLIVRPRNGSDSVQERAQFADAQFDLVIGVYRDEDDGWREVVDVIDAIRLDLAEAPTINGTYYEQTGPLTWELLTPADPIATTRPQWFGVVNTIWTLPRPRRVEARNPGEE